MKAALKNPDIREDFNYYINTGYNPRLNKLDPDMNYRKALWLAIDNYRKNKRRGNVESLGMYCHKNDEFGDSTDVLNNYIDSTELFTVCNNLENKVIDMNFNRLVLDMLAYDLKSFDNYSKDKVRHNKIASKYDFEFTIKRLICLWLIKSDLYSKLEGVPRSLFNKYTNGGFIKMIERLKSERSDLYIQYLSINNMRSQHYKKHYMRKFIRINRSFLSKIKFKSVMNLFFNPYNEVVNYNSILGLPPIPGYQNRSRSYDRVEYLARSVFINALKMNTDFSLVASELYDAINLKGCKISQVKY